MALMFKMNDIKNRERGLTFDDVLLIPQKSEIRSRKDPVLRSKLTKTKTLEVPIISANMDTITEARMAISMMKFGGLGIIHRFMTVENQVQEVLKLKEAGASIISSSIGVNADFKERAETLIKAGVNVVTIDIAHGHSVQMMDTLKWLKDTYTNVEVIAGNLATPDAAYDLIRAGADALKVGIGPGSMCTTRIITGCGVPQLTAIALCAEVCQEYGVPLIADGGFRTSGDMVKAFSAGADTIMLGSMLSGTIETPGDIANGRKNYRGMASKKAQVSWRGDMPQGMAPEGESTTVAVKGHVEDVLHELSGGIRSGMTYMNAQTISEMREKAIFMEKSPHGIAESKAHGVRN